jgi:hypothetical protein
MSYRGEPLQPCGSTAAGHRAFGGVGGGFVRFARFRSLTVRGLAGGSCDNECMNVSRASVRWDDLSVLRAGVRFNQRVGRPPRRLDLREPQRSLWEVQLGFALPSADQASRRFGSWSNFLRRLGYAPHAVGNPAFAPIEVAALAHVEEVYPGIEFVEAEQNAWDGLLVVDESRGAERVEVKGSVLSHRKDKPASAYFSFNVHRRDLSRIVDRLILVGLGYDADRSSLVPLCRLEFPKSALPRIDGISNVTIYSNSVFGASFSVHRPFVRWRRPGVTAQNAHLFSRSR